MKHNYLFISLLAMGLAAHAAENSKIDFFGQSLQIEYKQKLASGVLKPYSADNGDSRGDTVKVIVKFADGYSSDDIPAGLAEVETELYDNTAVVAAAVGSLDRLAGLEAVDRVIVGAPVKTCLDVAAADAKVDKVHAGEGLESGYDGTGIIVGLFDSGLDPNHPNFQSAGGESRVKRFYNASRNQVYNESNMASATTDNASATHGTHCAGILAGNGKKGVYSLTEQTKAPQANKWGTITVKTGVDIPFVGVANNADIYMGGGPLTHSNILSGCRRIIDYAAEQGKPAVISLSLGSVVGPHDNSPEIVSQLDRMSDDAIIVIAAGNDGDSNVAIKKTLTAGDNTLKTFVGARPIESAPFQFYASDNRGLSARIGLYDAEAGEMLYSYDLAAGSSATLTSSSLTDPAYVHDKAFDEAFTSGSFIIMSSTVDRANNRAYVSLSVNLIPASGKRVYPSIEIIGSAGQTILATSNDEGLPFASLGVEGYTEGSPDESINNLACGEKTIVVGSYTTRTIWPTLANGNRYQYNGNPTLDDISSFSSYGTTFSGRNLPVVCGPGMGVISSYSSYYTTAAKYTSTTSDATGYYKNSNGREYFWSIDQGTSMATPFVAGTIALWLQANPNLTTADVRQIIDETSRKDEFVTGGNPVRWGAGKIDALAGIKKALAMANAGVDDITSEVDSRLVVTRDGSGTINIYFAGAEQFTATLYSMTGAAVRTVTADGESADIDTASLGTGVYVLEVTGNSGRATRKLTI